MFKRNPNLFALIATCHSMCLLSDPLARVNAHFVSSSHTCALLMKEADSINMLALACVTPLRSPPAAAEYKAAVCRSTRASSNT